MITSNSQNIVVADLLIKIKQIINTSRTRLAQTINNELIKTYWEIGKVIVEKEKTNNYDNKSSRQIILELSKQLSKEIGKGFSRSNLFYMRNFYLYFPDVQTLSGQLTWSHYCELLAISDDNKRSFYEKETINSGWSVRDLKRQIASSLFERLLLSEGKPNKEKVMQLAKEGQVINNPSDLLKDPYVFEFLGITENKPILEKDLELKLIRHIEDFLLELGKGFMFFGSQFRITLNNVHHYIDLVFYNKILKAYILIDLKSEKFQPDNVGQMNMYLNYFKTEINQEEDIEPIGIILCTDKDEVVAEYALGGLTNQIFASKYVYYLPDKEILIREVERFLIEDKLTKQ
ncbi:MAG TPA: PDDEXK nuclease domain-containing protein [Ignavibacteriaceae bacterium]|nr:PDDEXK nuclease domain-containing protein [Ignavibacteriaceae bacterium]